MVDDDDDARDSCCCCFWGVGGEEDEGVCARETDDVAPLWAEADAMMLAPEGTRDSDAEPPPPPPRAETAPPPLLLLLPLRAPDEAAEEEEEEEDEVEMALALALGGRRGKIAQSVELLRNWKSWCRKWASRRRRWTMASTSASSELKDRPSDSSCASSFIAFWIMFIFLNIFFWICGAASGVEWSRVRECCGFRCCFC